MIEEKTKTREIDTGMSCLIAQLKILQIPFSVENLRHRLGKADLLDSSDIVFLTQEHLNLKSKHKKISVGRLKKLPLPVIAELKENRFCLIIKVSSDKIYIQNPITEKSESYSYKEFDRIFNNGVILISDRPSEKKIGDFENFGLGWFARAFMKHPFITSQILLSSLMMQIFILITPLFTMVIIDKVLSNNSTSSLEVLIIGLVIIAVFDFLINQIRNYLLHHTSNRVDLRLVSKLFQHLISLPMVFFSGKQSGDTISRLKEIESIRNFITGTALTALIDFPFSLLFLAVMYLFSPLLCVVVCFSVFISILTFAVAGPIMKKRIQKKQTNTTDSQSFLFETITSIETIKSLAAENRIQKLWEDQLVTKSENSSSSEILSNKLNQFAGFNNKATVAVCLWLGALAVLDGTMTAGQLIAFNMMVGRVMGPAQRIAQIFLQLHQIKVSSARIREIFQVKPEAINSSQLISLPRLEGHFKVEQVSFKYSVDSPLVLVNINLEFKAGEVIGVIGRSGSGKSTLMKLLHRLYTPTEGRILLDGINIAEIDPGWLRKNIGVVLQDNLLLNRSIRENISINNPNLNMEIIKSASSLSGADDFIRKLPQVYDTIVGERGSLLSAGQRQRIALARALINDPKIVILDEATSALDFESEQIFQENMTEICKNRTVFIVAHRFSALRNADRIITLDEGQIVEDGTIEELLKNRGAFFKLYRQQNISFSKITNQKVAEKTPVTEKKQIKTQVLKTIPKKTSE